MTRSAGSEETPPASRPGPAAGWTRMVLPPGRMDPAWMITARSHLIDRFSPDCEHIRLPSRSYGGGTLDYRVGEMRTGPCRARGRRARLKALLASEAERRVDGPVLMDLRRNAPENWAHFLMLHLPVVFHLAERTDTDWAQLLLLLPERTPRHIRRVAAALGLETLATDAPVRGQGIAHDFAPVTAIRGVRAGWVARARVQAAVDAAIATAPATGLPARVFLSRRGTRALVNEAEIAALLAARGYATVYPEDLSVVDQIRLLREADEIVAVHGAALGPLAYRAGHRPGGRIVELFPCGHVTDIWRAVAGEVGCDWIGVRGRIRPEQVRPAYDLARPFVRFSLQNFEIDPVSLERALEILAGRRCPDTDRASAP